MADTITDNRTQLADANNTTDGITGSWTGSTSVVQDTDVKIEGTGSIAEQMTNSVRTILWNRGSTFSLANTHIYIWVNCGVVGLLATKASGGFAIRFCGPSTANFFEAYVGGSDDWPTAVAGGWVQFVIDVGAVQASPSNTGGTPPAITAIQHIGVAAVTTAMTKVSDNTWVDAIWSLADGTPGIIVQGRNGGATAWTSADIYAQVTQAAGCFRPGPGGTWVLNTPIQFGANDTTTHHFADTNVVWLWDNQQFAASDLYGLSALGNAGGSTTVTFGVKTGSGDDATGAQGVTVAAASTGVRWAMDFNDANLNTIGFYGCSFQHGATFDLDASSVEVTSSLFIDIQRANIANSKQLRNGIVNAATADGVAFMYTDDLGDVVFCSFQHSDGHAVNLTAATPTTQNNKGNSFSGYTNTVNSTDAAILNSAAGALTISSSNGSNLETNSYRNTGGGSVTIENNISVTFTGMKDNTEVKIYDLSGNELAGTESATSGTTDDRSFTASLPASTAVRIAFSSLLWRVPPNDQLFLTWPTADSSLPVTQVVDRSYLNNSVVAFDDFERASLGSNWLDGVGWYNAVAISGGRIRASGTGTPSSGATFNAREFSADQFCQIEIGNLVNDGTTLVYPFVRQNTSTAAGYFLNADQGGAGSTLTLRKHLGSGAFSTIGIDYNPGRTLVAGDVIRLEVQGTTLRCFLNGVIFDTVVDSSYSSGQPGLGVVAATDVSYAEIESWVAGDI